MAGGFSAVAISWRGAPFVFLQLLQRAHCSGDHPLWRGTQIPSRPYGRPGSRWQTPLCLPCTVCKLEWYIAGRSPAGTSPPAQERKRKVRGEGIIAQLQRNSSRLLKQLHVWSAASAQNIYGWSLSLEAELVKSVIQKVKITIKTLSSWKPPPPWGQWCNATITQNKRGKKTEQVPACFTIRLSHDKNVNTPTSWCSARTVVFVTECDRCLLSGKKIPSNLYHKVVKNNRDASHLLQTCGQAHVAEVVAEERAWTVGGVPREQQPAEEGDVFTALHAAVQLCRSAQHQQLESLQQTELLFSTLKHSLTELLTLSVGGTVHRCLPLETNEVYQSLKRSKTAGYTWEFTAFFRHNFRLWNLKLR